MQSVEQPHAIVQARGSNPGGFIFFFSFCLLCSWKLANKKEIHEMAELGKTNKRARPHSPLDLVTCFFVFNQQTYLAEVSPVGTVDDLRRTRLWVVPLSSVL